MTDIVGRSISGAPFDLGDGDAYRRWRARKLADYPIAAADLVVELGDPARLTEAEAGALMQLLGKANMAIYDLSRASAGADAKETVRSLAARFGLRRLDPHPEADDDGITPLQVVDGGTRQRYIPYTDRPINWHTDGYYNAPDRTVRAMILHCAGAAESGGESMLMDHELAYIALRDEDPGLVAALSHPGAMTIPANQLDGVETRGAQSGPVFSVDAEDGALHMRFTARPRNVVWRDDAATRDAVGRLAHHLDRDRRHAFRLTLAPGQGLICNNVLHGRSGFVDGPDQRRLVYRARFYDRIAGTAAY
jgi:hypothetical protein